MNNKSSTKVNIVILLIVLIVWGIMAYYGGFSKQIDSLWSWLWYENGNVKEPDKIGRIIAPIVSLIGLLLIWWQLHLNAVQARRTRTYEIVGKYYDPPFLEFTKDGRARLRDSNSITQKEVTDDPECIVKVMTFFNYFEDACLMYNNNLIDRELFKDNMDAVVYNSYKRYESHIESLKKLGYAGKSGYKEWKITSDEFEESVTQDSITQD